MHKTKAYQSPAWKDYVAMNQAFADKIVSVYKKGDLSEWEMLQRAQAVMLSSARPLLHSMDK